MRAFNTCSTDHGQGRRSYRDRADFFAVYVAGPSRVFIVPVDECPSYVALLRLLPAKNNQRRGVRMAERYDLVRWVQGISVAVADDQVPDR